MRALRNQRHLVSMLIGLCVMLACLSRSAHAQAGLRLPFDGSLTGTRGQTPTTATGMTFAEGKLGMAASFDAGDVLEYASAGNIGHQEGTLAFWFRPDSAFVSGRNYEFVAWGGVGGLIIGVDGYPYLRMICNRFVAGGEVGVNTQVSTWNPGVWYHVAFTWSSANRRLRVYVGGELKAEAPLTGDLPVISDPVLKIGSEGGATDANGEMDDLHIYGRESSPFQIAELAKWRRDGEVWAWGGNDYGQIGDGSTVAWDLPMRVSALRGAVAVSAGTLHSLALKADGTVWAWGSNYYGQLGDSTNTDHSTPTQVIGLGDVSAIGAGNLHSIALKYDGTVWSWGDNVYGQLGDGTTVARWTAGQVPGLSGVIAIAAGEWHNYALKADGTLWAWGYNGTGQLGDGTTTARIAPVQVASLGGVVRIASGGWHGVAVLADGSVWTWGLNRNGQIGDGTTTDQLLPVRVAALPVAAKDVAAGYDHTIALDHEGAVWAWGHNGHGSLGDGTSTGRLAPVQVHGPDDVGFITNVERIEAGYWHSMATRRDGTVWTWGWNGYGQIGDGTISSRFTPVQVPYLNGIHASSGGYQHTLALCRTDYQLWASGDNYYGQLGLGDMARRSTSTQVPLAGVKAVAAGENHTLALTSDGRVWAWGGNYDGQLGLGDRTDRNTPVEVTFFYGKTVTALGTGDDHTIALTSDGKVWAWGDNYSGQLGLGDWTDRLTPTEVTFFAGRTVTALVAGGYHTIALTSDGRMWAWGWNDFGQLGLGDTNDRGTPTEVTFFSGQMVTTLIAGGAHTLALTSDANVWAWGMNWSGQLGLGDLTQRSTPTAVTFFAGKAVTTLVAGGHTLALTSDGKVWAWGWNEYGQLGLGDWTDHTTPAEVTFFSGNTVTGAAAGLYHTLARTSDGKVQAWGRNTYGQLGLGDTTDRSTPTEVSFFAGRTVSAQVAGGYHTLALTSVNAPPVADPQIVGAFVGVPTRVTLTGSDEEGDPLTFHILSGPFHGGLDGTPPNVHYTSDPAYSGPDSFTFAVSDGFTYSAPATVTIEVAKIPTSLMTEDGLGTVGSTIALRQYDLKITPDNALLAGRTIAYSIDGTGIGTATTDTGGDSSLDWVIVAGPQTRTIGVEYAGDAMFEGSSATATLTVSRIATKTNTIDRTGVGASAVLLRGYLYRKTDSVALSGKTLTFAIAGTQVGSGTTSASGSASLSWVIDAGTATRQIRVDFAGDLTFEPSFGTATLTVLTYDSTLLVPNRAGEIGDAVSLRAYLYRSPQPLAVSGKTVGFLVDGTSVGSAVTNTNGRALLSWVVPDTLAPGSHALVADWPGDAGYRPSSGTATLTVDKGVTYVWLMSRSMARGTSAYLRTLVRRMPDLVPLPNKTIQFSVDGTALGTAMTGTDGRASYLYAAPSDMTTGDHQQLAEFAGDTHYLPGAGTAILTITP